MAVTRRIRRGFENSAAAADAETSSPSTRRTLPFLLRRAFAERGRRRALRPRFFRFFFFF
ncbi:MAG: hypothetical protein AAFU79_22440 [Myxococcota bacterium]